MPTPEYCLLFIDWWPMCMTKAEWSGWAQAIGAMIALGIAIWLPAKARRNARRDSKIAVLSFMAGAVFALDRARDACAAQSWADFFAIRLLLLDAVNLGTFLNTAGVSGKILANALAVRASVFELYHRCEGHSASGNWAHWEAQFTSVGAGSRELIARTKKLKA